MPGACSFTGLWFEERLIVIKSDCLYIDFRCASLSCALFLCVFSKHPSIIICQSLLFIQLLHNQIALKMLKIYIKIYMRGAPTCFGFSQPSSGSYYMCFAKVISINPQATNVIYIYGAPILDVSRSHTPTQHSRQDSSGRVISSSQRPLPDNT